MDPVGKALWFIESHFAGDVTLDDVAAIGGLSRYHMSRAFGVATGHSAMRYVRGRRVTEAARSPANGAPDILAVALDAGYGSHEAFTRAFRDQFGLTPEQVRAQRHLDNIELVEPIKIGRRRDMDTDQTVDTNRVGRAARARGGSRPRRRGRAQPAPTRQRFDQHRWG